MKHAPFHPTQGFTLPEALIATSLFLLLLGGITAANVFGLRMFQLSETKLNAGDGARKSLRFLVDEVRQCKRTWVGSVSNGIFVAALDGQPQVGSALLVQPTANPTNFVCYYRNAADQSLRRLVGLASSTTVLAQMVTNAAVFESRDHFGKLLTNQQNNRVTHITLEFFQPQSWLPVPDYAKLETSVSQRVE
jgi:hypothetical protein